jgi:hypothetical protein
MALAIQKITIEASRGECIVFDLLPQYPNIGLNIIWPREVEA